MAATSYAPVSVSGSSHLRTRAVTSSGSPFLVGKAPALTVSVWPNRSSASRSLSVSARYNDGDTHGAGDFFAGFILGGAIFGTLTYIYSPQLRRVIQNEDEHGFTRLPKRGPIYRDDSLKSTRQTLNEKLNQLNNAIDKVAQRLRGDNKKTPTPDIDPADVLTFPDYDVGVC